MMNERQKNNIQESVRYILNRDGWRCQRCGNPATQVAHCVSQDHSRKQNRNNVMVRRVWQELFGEVLDRHEACDIINHPLNLKASCDTCNSYFNIGNNPVAVEIKLMEIHAAMQREKFTKAWRGVV